MVRVLAGLVVVIAGLSAQPKVNAPATPAGKAKPSPTAVRKTVKRKSIATVPEKERVTPAWRTDADEIITWLGRIGARDPESVRRVRRESERRRALEVGVDVRSIQALDPELYFQLQLKLRSQSEQVQSAVALSKQVINGAGPEKRAAASYLSDAFRRFGWTEEADSLLQID